MKNGLIRAIFALIILSTAISTFAAEVTDPLPSWNDSPIKKSIIEFVQAVTDKASQAYVAPENRIVTIDNDGTLWVEQPLYTQETFILARYNELTKDRKGWPKITEKNLNQKNIQLAFSLTSTDMTVEEYEESAKEWLATAQNQHFHRLYTQLVYQPMLEVIKYLQQNDFDVYIVSGGGQDFIRSFAQEVYGIAPDHVIGSATKTKYDYNSGRPRLLKITQSLLITDKTGKPEAINLFIGKKPIAAIGNSDGDRQMLEWAQSNPAKHLMLLVHHDDAEREYAYGPESKVGTFSDSLMKEAEEKKWGVISMKNDWKTIFAVDKSK